MSQETRSDALGYARAVYELALEGWQKSLQAVNDALSKDPGLLAQLNDAQTSFAQRQQQLDGILSPDLTAQTRNFLYTLLKDGKLHLLEDISNNLFRLATKGVGVQLATVTTAVSLTQPEEEQFRQKLTAQYGEGLELDFAVDEAIMGGVVVQIGDKILDGSLATRLNSIRDNLAAG